jgi:putative DNA primase/helicase
VTASADVSVHPFRDASEQYLSAGWPVIPIFPALGNGAKGTPLKGTTGREGIDLTPEQVAEYILGNGQLNIAVRCPVGVVGLDVDHYDDKTGGDTLERWAAQWGPLPETYVSTSRDDEVSGIRWYRVPEDWVGIGGAESIELIQRHHRFALVWPSLHPQGRRYRWLDQRTGLELDVVPPVDALPELPQAYRDGLKSESAGDYHGIADFDQADIDMVLTEGDECPAVLKALRQYPEQTKQGRAHHDVMIKVQMELLRLGEQGHKGVEHALAALYTWFTKDRGAERDTKGEWGRAFHDGLSKVLANPTADEDKGCCSAKKEKPGKVKTDDRFTDARLADLAAYEVMTDRFIWVPGMDWLTWDKTRWVQSEEETVRDAVRQWIIDQFNAVIAEGKTGSLDKDAVQGWLKAQSRGRIAAITDLTKGIVLVRVKELDADPDLLNTPQGVVDMRTGEVQEHRPDHYMTAITKGSYIAGYRHPDWEQALEAVPDQVRTWFQTRSGQAATGHPVPDDMMLVFQGSGANGKTTVTSGGPVVALGDYGNVASHKLFMKGGEHSTERADLRGRRYLVAEELTEGRSIDITALKQIVGTTRLKARYLYKDNIEFDASHTLFVTTNYVPIVNEVDHGTWRRLCLVRFPYTFRNASEELAGDNDKRGDIGLRDRIRLGKKGQHDAVVTWLVEGAIRWYAEQADSLVTPELVREDTRAWQRDADRILGFWDEMLVPSRDHAIVTAELLNVFNRWVEENGHNPWSKETFHPRFAQHSETAKHRVQHAKPRAYPELSRPANQYDRKDPLPGRPSVYLYVRFRNPDETEPSDLHGPTGPTLPKLPRDSENQESFLEGRTGRTTRQANVDESAVSSDPFDRTFDRA